MTDIVSALIRNIWGSDKPKEVKEEPKEIKEEPKEVKEEPKEIKEERKKLTIEEMIERRQKEDML